MTTLSKTPEYRREYYAANRERELASRKKYRDNNVEKCYAASVAWKEKNPEKVRAYSAKYADKKSMTKAMDDWNNTLLELGYADLI
jgi:hypothetical protein